MFLLYYILAVVVFCVEILKGLFCKREWLERKICRNMLAASMTFIVQDLFKLFYFNLEFVEIFGTKDIFV